MDAESIKPLLWILFWGGLFFLMMRYGCGAHMMGGHRHGGGHGGQDGHGDSGGDKDPVCGMDVIPGSAAAATLHAGRTYYFCSRSCRDKFEQSPEQYLNAPSEGGHHG
jgi:YHS domain-containing protein